LLESIAEAESRCCRKGEKFFALTTYNILQPVITCYLLGAIRKSLLHKKKAKGKNALGFKGLLLRLSSNV
jgi:hypothetical protein